MIKIFFKHSADAKALYESLCAKQSALSYGPQCFKIINSQLLVINVSENRDAVLQDIVIPVVTDYIITYKEQEMLLSILQSMFLYTHTDEQSQILQMVQSILDGERQDIPQMKFPLPKELLIRESLEDFLVHNVTFTFESFLQFRLKEYYKRLVYYVEIGIDEYKMEQEYQILIEQLRQAVGDSNVNKQDVHVLHEEKDIFTIYNNNFIKMVEGERQRLSEAFSSSYHTIYIDRNVVAPLITMAPANVYVYTDYPAHHLIQTIQTIFQEKAVICDRRTFSFGQKQEVDF